MKDRRDRKKAAKKRVKVELGEDDNKLTVKKPKKSIIVPQRLESSTINSKLNTITGISQKWKHNFFCFFFVDVF